MGQMVPERCWLKSVGEDGHREVDLSASLSRLSEWPERYCSDLLIPTQNV